MRLLEVQQNLGELVHSDLSLGGKQPKAMKKQLFGQLLSQIEDARALAIPVNLRPAIVVLISTFRGDVDQLAKKMGSTAE